MVNQEQPQPLETNGYKTLIIRFLINKAGQMHGEVVVVDQNHQSLGLFRQVDELIDLIRRWVLTQLRPEHSNMTDSYQDRQEDE